jgi:hypothetical protein
LLAALGEESIDRRIWDSFSVLLRQGLRARDSLSGCSQHETIRRLIQIDRAAADEPKPLSDVSRQAHSAIGRDVAAELDEAYTVAGVLLEFN